MHYACMTERETVIRVLIRCNRSSLLCDDHDGQVPLVWLVAAGRLELFSGAFCMTFHLHSSVNYLCLLPAKQTTQRHRPHVLQSYEPTREAVLEAITVSGAYPQLLKQLQELSVVTLQDAPLTEDAPALTLSQFKSPYVRRQAPAVPKKRFAKLCCSRDTTEP
eukprot:TRINITY_DN3742_c1_g1_i2.p1 TRINITY_DN3742_c1_g1~~TRINITY_DN3742_c1_g1_i2.p1  ORF type:complete len:163 (+),score=17.17 TRINITY_DN3742_c1_g1_i2:496-984(+)